MAKPTISYTPQQVATAQKFGAQIPKNLMPQPTAPKPTVSAPKPVVPNTGTAASIAPSMGSVAPKPAPTIVNDPLRQTQTASMGAALNPSVPPVTAPLKPIAEPVPTKPQITYQPDAPVGGAPNPNVPQATGQLNPIPEPLGRAPNPTPQPQPTPSPNPYGGIVTPRPPNAAPASNPNPTEFGLDRNAILAQARADGTLARYGIDNISNAALLGAVSNFPDTALQQNATNLGVNLGKYTNPAGVTPVSSTNTVAPGTGNMKPIPEPVPSGGTNMPPVQLDDVPSTWSANTMAELAPPPGSYTRFYDDNQATVDTRNALKKKLKTAQGNTAMPTQTKPKKNNATGGAASTNPPAVKPTKPLSKGNTNQEKTTAKAKQGETPQTNKQKRQAKKQANKLKITYQPGTPQRPFRSHAVTQSPLGYGGRIRV